MEIDYISTMILGFAMGFGSAFGIEMAKFFIEKIKKKEIKCGFRIRPLRNP